MQKRQCISHTMHSTPCFYMLQAVHVQELHLCSVWPCIAMQGCMDPHIDAVLQQFAAVLRQLLSAGADLEAVDDEV